MRSSSRLVRFVSVFVLAATVAAACADEDASPRGPAGVDACEPSAAECVGARAARACPPDGSGWVSFACSPGEVCTDGACGVGTTACTAGEAQCATDRLALVCGPDGSAWLPSPCAADERCDAGSCVPAGDAGTACIAGEEVCASDGVLKVCEADGSGWLYQPCAAGEICAAGACAYDVARACAPGERACVDAGNQAACAADGSGWEVTACTGGTTCTGLGCAGTCVQGASRCVWVPGRSALATCVDGWLERVEECPSGEACVGGVGGERCAPTDGWCEPDRKECGNPDDTTVDPLRFYSRCVQDPATGAWAWATVGECVAPLECADQVPWEEEPCRSSTECAPGEVACRSGGLAECQSDGTWGPSAPCGADQECQWYGGALRCVDAPCLGELGGGIERGVCVGDQFRGCDAEGRLLPAADCAEGRCQPTWGQYQGFPYGSCQADCAAGESMCTFAGSPEYRVCQAGLWELAVACPAGEVCLDFHDPVTDLDRALCGVDCAPGARRCATGSPSQAVEECQADGTWGTAVPCTLGLCTGAGTCVVECLPGSVRCEGATRTASDGLSSGTTVERTCDATGTWGAAVDCVGTATCRTSGRDQAVGCVECIGPDVPGGNALGTVDSRCAGTSVQACGAGNDWATPTPCASGSCVVLSEASGTCSEDCYGCSPFFGCRFYTCSASTLRMINTTCEAQNAGSPVACGTTPDCCSDRCVATPSTAGVAVCGGTCGNGVRELGEECDGADLGVDNCSSATLGGRPSGTLACNSLCRFDIAGCYTGSGSTGGGGAGGGTGGNCGNGLCELGEAGWCADCALCGNRLCEPGEEVGCPSDCPTTLCGNGICEGGEEVICRRDCSVCGDGICEPGEEGRCPECTPVCGNGLCEPGEDPLCADCGGQGGSGGQGAAGQGGVSGAGSGGIAGAGAGGVGGVGGASAGAGGVGGRL